MFGFLKRAADMVKTYSAGKAFEEWYKVAELTTMMYVQKLWCRDNDPTTRNFAMCVWSYLLFTEPRSPELLEAIS